MAKQYIPFVKSGYLASNGYTPFVHGNGLTTNVEPEPQYETLTGDIVTFNSLRVQPLEALSCAITPVQDLHGQSAPYPAGGGVNKFNPDAIVSGTYSGTKWTLNNVSMNDSLVTMTFEANTQYTFSGTATQGVVNKNYRIQIVYTDDTVTNLWASNDTTAVPFSVTSTSGKSIDRIRTQYSSTGGSVVVDKFQIEVGTTAHSFAPYANLCPISGWSEAKVTRTGANVWDEEWESGSYKDDGTKEVNNSRIRCKNPIHVAPSTTYYVNASTSNYELYVLRYTASGSFIAKNLIRNTTFNTTADTSYILFFIAGLTTYNNDISINYPSTDHSYHAHSIQTVTIDLSGTRCGGTLDVLAGELTVTYQSVDMGDMTWHKSSSGNKFYARIPLAYPWELTNTFYCSMYKPDGRGNDSIGYYGDNGTIKYYQKVGAPELYELYVHDENYSTDESFKTAVTGQTVVMPLATPLSVQLSASTLSTLLGQNNIWSTTGQSTVTYQTN